MEPFVIANFIILLSSFNTLIVICAMNLWAMLIMERGNLMPFNLICTTIALLSLDFSLYLELTTAGLYLIATIVYLSE